jgi:hypothetical protein
VRIEEIALQQWRGDRIVHERFFYDPSPVVAAIQALSATSEDAQP